MTAVRSYIAGTGAAGALVGAAAVSFALLTALVGFNGFPIGGDSGGTHTVSLASASARASRVVATPAALAVGGAPGAVAPAAVLAPTTAPAAAAPVSTVPTSTPPGSIVNPIEPPGNVGTNPNPPDLPGPDPTPPAGGNPVQNVAGGVDQTVQNATGVNLNLSGVTAPLTNTVDNTLRGLTGRTLGQTLDALNLKNPLNGHPLVGQPGTGLAGTGLLP